MSDGVDSRREILTVLGPTAVGKTAVAIVLARLMGGEIVSADSRQVYRGMDIGTAKPTANERALARHHLIDIADPSEQYDAARFARDAEAVISDLVAGGVRPLVVGGTGFYVASLFEGLFEGPGRNEAVRMELTERAGAEGCAVLHQELAAVDAESAARIHANDLSRIVRALEVYLTTGKPLSRWHAGAVRSARFRPLYVGLRRDRESLWARVDRRVDAMVKSGLIEEIEHLLATGALSPEMPAASAVGYRELLPFVQSGKGEVGQAIELIKRNTRRYAKRQMTWFRSVAGIRWLDLDELTPEEAARAIVER